MIRRVRVNFAGAAIVTDASVVLIGADRPSEGRVEAFGRKVSETDPAFRRDVATIVDDLDFFPDLSVVEHIADRIAIMYLGRIVEMAPTEALFAEPNHPYAIALLDGVPKLNERKRVYMPIKGEVPSPLDPPSGCHFHPRCPRAFDRCRAERPVLKPIAPGRFSACHLND